MKVLIPGLCFLVMSVQWSYAQQTKENPSPAEQEIINLSKQKWLWMADKNVDSLDVLFDEKSVFVHMGGSWVKTPVLNTFNSGGFWYMKAYDTSLSAYLLV